MKERQIEEFYQINPKYIKELYFLQIELLKLQKHIADHNLRLVIFFEGRDTAGKGAAIFRFSQFLNPRNYRIVALGKPTEEERGQWYFQRYLKEFPNAGEIVFFDRSWYNRAVVEPAMDFCTKEEHERFIKQVKPLEKMLIDDGILMTKFWFSINADAQKSRIQERLDSPLKRWKVSPVDMAAQEKWNDFSRYKNRMFDKTDSDRSPWMIVRGEVREESRIQAMRYVLSLVDYDDKSPDLLPPDSKVVFRWKSEESQQSGYDIVTKQKRK